MMLLVNRNLFSLNPPGLLKIDLKRLQVKLFWWKYLFITQTCLKPAELSALCHYISEGSISQILNSGDIIMRRNENKLPRLCYCYKWLILWKTGRSLFIFLNYLKEEQQNADYFQPTSNTRPLSLFILSVCCSITNGSLPIKVMNLI